MHWGPAAGSGTQASRSGNSTPTARSRNPEDAQRAALSVLQNFDDELLEEDSYGGRISSSRSLGKLTPSLLDEEMWAATPVTRAEPEKEAPAAAPLAVESAAPLAAAGAWLATLPPKVVVEAPAPPTIAPHGNSSSTVDDEGAASDFVVRAGCLVPCLPRGSLVTFARVAVRRSGGGRGG